jgi:hypothetical protein
MAKFTTADCKQFLETHAIQNMQKIQDALKTYYNLVSQPHNTSCLQISLPNDIMGKNWKRTSKYKNDNGGWTREFMGPWDQIYSSKQPVGYVAPAGPNCFPINSLCQIAIGDAQIVGRVMEPPNGEGPGFKVELKIIISDYWGTKTMTEVII